MPNEYSMPAVSVDVALLTLADRRLQVAVAERAVEPARGRLALFGGYIHIDEDQDAAAAARRVLGQRRRQA